MNRFSALALALGLLSAAPAFAGTPEERGLEIAKMMDKANEGFVGESSSSTMTLINAHGDETKRKMRMKVHEMPEDGDKSISVFEWPADVKGTKLLTWAHRKADDDQWLYLPAIKRVKRISSSSKSGSFMGSEFAYEDLGSQEVDKYTYKFVAEETLEGRKTWKQERVPVDKRSGYSKQVTWIDQEYKNVVRIDYYDRKGELLKQGYFRKYKKYGNFWRMNEIEMVNVQTKKKSILSWEDRKLGVALDEDEFESDALVE